MKRKIIMGKNSNINILLKKYSVNMTKEDDFELTQAMLADQMAQEDMEFEAQRKRLCITVFQPRLKVRTFARTNSYEYGKQVQEPA